MTIETRLRNTGQQGGGGASSSSAGLAGTGGLYVVTSASPLLPNSRILTAGSSVTTTTDGTAVYVTALTTWAYGTLVVGSGGTGSSAFGAGGIVFSSGGILTTDSANLYWDDSSNRLAIGTNAAVSGKAVIRHDNANGPIGLVIESNDSGTSFRPFQIINRNTVGASYGSFTLASENAAVEGQLNVAGATAIGVVRANTFNIRALGMDALDLAMGSAADSVKATLRSNGRFGFNVTEPLAQVNILANSIGLVGLIVQSTGAYTVDHIQVQNSAGSVISAFNSAGYLALNTNATPIPLTVVGSTRTTHLSILSSTGNSILIGNSAGTILSLNTGATGQMLVTSGGATLGMAWVGTGGGGGGAVYAPTGGYYFVQSGHTNLSNAIVITSGQQAYLELEPQRAKLYSNTSAAGIDAGTPSWRLLFSATTQQFGIYQFLMPMDYGSAPLLRLVFGSDSTAAAAQSAWWKIDTWGVSPGGALLGAYQDTFGGVNTGSVNLANPWTSGNIVMLTVPLATVVSFGANNLIRIRISGSAGAGLVGKLELIGCTFEYMKQ